MLAMRIHTQETPKKIQLPEQFQDARVHDRPLSRGERPRQSIMEIFFIVGVTHYVIDKVPKESACRLLQWNSVHCML